LEDVRLEALEVVTHASVICIPVNAEKLLNTQGLPGDGGQVHGVVMTLVKSPKKP
jgi:hypothetical protein